MSFTVAFIKKQPAPPSPTPDPSPLPQYIIVDRAGHEASDQGIGKFTWTDPCVDNIGMSPVSLDYENGEIRVAKAFIGQNDAGDSPCYVFKIGNYWCYSATANNVYGGVYVSETLDRKAHV